MNLLPPPSPNRAEYPFVASLDFQGIPVDVEQRKGDTREGVDKDGAPWKVTMHAHYGEIRSHARGASGVMGAKGMDGDRLDVYIGPDDSSDLVVVVDQRIPETGEHDEQKVMLGFPSVQAALDCYRKQYTKPGFYGGHSTMSVEDFKRKIADRSQAGRALRKGGRGMNIIGQLHRAIFGATYEIPAFMAEGFLYKAASHKYIRRVPKPGGKGYRYYYTVGGGHGLGHHAEFQVGSAFRMKDQGKEGHFHVNAVHDDGHVTVKHDESGTEHRLHKDALAAMLKNEHAEALQTAEKESGEKREASKKRALSDLAEARAAGSEKHVERLKREAVKHGASEEETLSPAELEQRKRAAEESARKRGEEPEAAPTEDKTKRSGDPSARVTVRFAAGDGITITGTSRSDAEALRAVAQRHGLRWAPSIGAWIKPQSRSWSAADYRANSVHQIAKDLTEAGIPSKAAQRFEIHDAATKEAERQERSEARSERLSDKAEALAAESSEHFGRARKIGDMIPFGQPILVGHHSESRHRSDANKIHGAMQRGVEAHREAESAARSAAAAEQNAKPKTAAQIERKLSTLESEQRKVARNMADPRGESEWKERLAIRASELENQIAFWRGEMTKMGADPSAMRSALKPGDIVMHRGSPAMIVRVGPKNATVRWLHAPELGDQSGKQLSDIKPVSEEHQAAIKEKFSSALERIANDRRSKGMAKAMAPNLLSQIARAARNLTKGAGVETPADEAAWQRAKDIVDKEHGGHEGKWALVQHIFQQIKAGKHGGVSKAMVAIAVVPSVNPVIARLLTLLGHTQNLADTAQHFHWNVKGPHFHSLHEQFGEFYEQAIDATDEIAERVRALGVDVPAPPVVAIDNGPPEMMVAALAAMHETCARLCREAAQAAEAQGDQATIDLVGKRQRECEKAAWMLRSTLGQQASPGIVLKALAKAARAWNAPREYEIPTFMVEGMLAKAAGHKYLRRVPKPGGGYRYYYTVGGGKGLGHHSEFQAGSAFRMKDQGKQGHFHVTHEHDDGHVTIRHDESGAEHKVHKDALAAMLRAEHAEEIGKEATRASEKREAAKKRALADLAEARKVGGKGRYADAAKKRALAAGASEDETLTDEEREARKPKAATVEMPPAKEASEPAPMAAEPPREKYDDGRWKPREGDAIVLATSEGLKELPGTVVHMWPKFYRKDGARLDEVRGNQYVAGDPAAKAAVEKMAAAKKAAAAAPAPAPAKDPEEAPRHPRYGQEVSEKRDASRIVFRGNTKENRDWFKRLGGKWDAVEQTWVVPASWDAFRELPNMARNGIKWNFYKD